MCYMLLTGLVKLHRNQLRYRKKMLVSLKIQFYNFDILGGGTLRGLGKNRRNQEFRKTKMI